MANTAKLKPKGALSMKTKSLLLASAAMMSVGGFIRKEIGAIDPTGDFQTACNTTIYLATNLAIDPGEIPATLDSINQKRDELLEQEDKRAASVDSTFGAVTQAIMANAKRSADADPIYQVLFAKLGYDFGMVDELDTDTLARATAAGHTLGAAPLDDHVVHAAAAE